MVEFSRIIKLNGFEINQIGIDEMIFDNDYKKRNLKLFLNKPHKYDTYHVEGGHAEEIENLIELGLLRGHAIHVKNYMLHGYITITELGKTWLEFNDL